MSAIPPQNAGVPPPPDDPNADLGFGSIVARESRKRLLNRDGTFNVRRTGLSFWESHSAYHYFLTLTWTRFLAMLAAGFVIANLVFASAYLACGQDALTGFPGLHLSDRFARAFFFSVHTIATIGYGNVAPVNLAANIVVVIEALVGLIGFAFIAGIVFARFARPVARIVFSRYAVVAPYRDRTAFMFRIVNQQSNEIVEMETKVLFARRKKDGGVNDREFLQLPLERERVVFFPLAWTIVHPIDESSPLHGLTGKDLEKCDAEFPILLNGFDETFSQTVHTRSSYKAGEVVWGAKFKSMFREPEGDGTISVDVRDLHEIERQ